MTHCRTPSSGIGLGSIHKGSSWAGATLFLMAALGCSVGEGAGQVHSDRLRVENCWDGPFDLNPDFFGGVPYRESFQIRIQDGSEIQEVSDGLSVLVRNVHQIRGEGGEESLLGIPLEVGLPSDVTPPGVVSEPDSSPPLVHMAFYLHATCHEQLSALYAVRGFITFENLFNGDPNETSAEARLTGAVFDVLVADPRAVGQDGQIPEHKLSRVTGWFKFYFERGQPSQPFP